MILEVDEQNFAAQVVERSRERPVVVDFWAAWCGPCRQLTPALESAARAREGKIDLAKVDVDANPQLAQSFQVQGIPAVKAFKDGRVVDEFTGALPPVQVERFFDGLVPSEADALAQSTGDETALRRALELDPRHLGAATALGLLLLRRGEPDAAIAVLEPLEHDFLAAGLAARALLTGERPDLDPAWEAWDSGDHETALENLQQAFADADGAERDRIRQAMIAIFTQLGPGHPLAREHRRRLSSALH